MAALHTDRTESWVDGLRPGSSGSVDTRPLHWSVLTDPGESIEHTQIVPSDTMGYAFTFHIFTTLGGIPVGAYVHYPTISTDMLERVKSRKAGHTNSDAISSSFVLSKAKLLYASKTLNLLLDVF